MHTSYVQLSLPLIDSETYCLRKISQKILNDNSQRHIDKLVKQTRSKSFFGSVTPMLFIRDNQRFAMKFNLTTTARSDLFKDYTQALPECSGSSSLPKPRRKRVRDGTGELSEVPESPKIQITETSVLCESTRQIYIFTIFPYLN